MKIDHIGMYVEDLEGAKYFWEKYFHVSVSDLYHNKRTDFRSYFLEFDNGARLEIMTKPGLTNENRGLNSMGYIHLAV